MIIRHCLLSDDLMCVCVCCETRRWHTVCLLFAKGRLALIYSGFFRVIIVFEAFRCLLGVLLNQIKVIVSQQTFVAFKYHYENIVV